MGEKNSDKKDSKALLIVKEALENKEAMERKRKDESLAYSVKDSAAVNSTVGFGDHYLSAYGVAMNATNSQITMLTSVPNLIAPLAQLFTPKVMEKVPRRKIFSVSILIQSLLWVPIILVALFFINGLKNAPLFLIIFFTLYAIAGNFAGPAWASWIGDLIDKKNAGNFFGFRNKIGGACALVSIIIGGLILNFFDKTIAPITGKTWMVLVGFSIIFFFAMIFRLISRHYVLKQYEPPFKTQEGYYFSFLSFVKKSYKNNFGRFSIFVACIVIATNIGGPLFTLYVLKELNFSYMQYTIYILASTVSSFIFMSFWGKFSDKYGYVRLIKITGFMVPFVAFLFGAPYFFWQANAHATLTFWFIVGVQFFSGFAWAGFNLASGNFVYDVATPQRRSLCVAYSSILNGIGVFIGATIGGILSTILPITFMSKILFVLLLSGVCRLIVILIFYNKIREVKTVEKYKSFWFFWKNHHPVTPMNFAAPFIYPMKFLGKMIRKGKKS
jgi:MFS family permease